MYRIFSMIFIISLAGCATNPYSHVPAPSPITYDAAIADNLPLPVAQEYIQTLTLSEISPRCIFNLNSMSAGSSGQYPYSAFTLRSESTGMVVYYGDIESYKRSLIMGLLGHQGEKKYCLFNVPELSRIKASTAFKALGVMLE